MPTIIDGAQRELDTHIPAGAGARGFSGVRAHVLPALTLGALAGLAPLITSIPVRRPIGPASRIRLHRADESHAKQSRSSGESWRWKKEGDGGGDTYAIEDDGMGSVMMRPNAADECCWSSFQLSCRLTAELARACYCYFYLYCCLISLNLKRDEMWMSAIFFNWRLK